MAEFPVTLDNLVGRVRRLLEESPRLDRLAAAIADSGTTSVTVDTPSLFKADTKFEVDDEVFLVVTGEANPLVVKRGYVSTTAAAHSDNAPIILDPRYPQASIKEAINVVLNNWISTYVPRIQWDTTTAGTFTTNRWIYQAPADAIKVRKVAFQIPGYTALQYVDHGPIMQYPTSIVASGLGVEIWEMGLPGRNVMLYYESPWPHLDTGGAQVPSDFPGNADELIVTGAALYLLGWRIIPKIRLDEIVFHRESNAPVPPNISLGAIDKFQSDWIKQIQRIAGSRPGSHSTKVWR